MVPKAPNDCSFAWTKYYVLKTCHPGFSSHHSLQISNHIFHVYIYILYGHHYPRSTSLMFFKAVSKYIFSKTQKWLEMDYIESCQQAAVELETHPELATFYENRLFQPGFLSEVARGIAGGVGGWGVFWGSAEEGFLVAYYKWSFTMGARGPYKWPKIHGFHWVYFVHPYKWRYWAPTYSRGSPCINSKQNHHYIIIWRNLRCVSFSRFLVVGVPGYGRWWSTTWLV